MVARFFLPWEFWLSDVSLQTSSQSTAFFVHAHTHMLLITVLLFNQCYLIWAESCCHMQLHNGNCGSNSSCVAGHLSLSPHINAVKRGEIMNLVTGRLVSEEGSHFCDCLSIVIAIFFKMILTLMYLQIMIYQCDDLNVCVIKWLKTLKYRTSVLNILLKRVPRILGKSNKRWIF